MNNTDKVEYINYVTIDPDGSIFGWEGEPKFVKGEWDVPDEIPFHIGNSAVARGDETTIFKADPIF